MNYAVLLLILAGSIMLAQQPSSCKLPLKPADISHPSTIVGSGAPASCTEQALGAAIAVGGVITFNCGSQAATIPITSQKTFRNDMNTVIDGGNQITLQGNGHTRLFFAQSGIAPWYGGTPPYYQSTHTSVTFQNITVENGKSHGTPLPPLPPGASPTCSQGTEINGGGGFIYVQDMVLHMINATVVNNHAAPLGPDVAGGGVYVFGSVDLTVQDSTFKDNNGANGGAIGELESNVTVVKSVFRGNQALGHDGNHNVPSSGCPINQGQYQVGDGGNGGAVYLDGQDTAGPRFCGNLFATNQGGVGALGGAIFGAGDPGTQNLSIAQSEFDDNSDTQGKGGAIYAYQNDLVIDKSTFSNNSATIGGALEGDYTNVTATNNTFSGNTASINVGVLALFNSSSGTLTNNTFSGNQAPHFPILYPGSSSGPPPTLTITNNLFVSNVATLGHLACFTTFPGSANFLWPSSDYTPAPEGACASGEVTTDPLLGALGYNGGFTQTIPIPTDSPAAEAATTSCPPHDQRGVSRLSPCASGSYQPVN
jgi:parallel beta-helix repeat protein